MSSLPPLLLVHSALPVEFLPLFHVHQLVSDFFTPRTIDGAVYNELPRVMAAFESFRPWTVGAMDGATSQGRLEILQKLHSTRTEGCSSRAFVGAAANAHLEVLWWLNEYYASLAQPAEMVKVAAANGHDRVVEFLWGRLTSEDLKQAAVSSGHGSVAEILRLRVSNLTATCETNGEELVLQF